MSDRKKAIETLKQLRFDYEEFYEEHNNEVTQAYDMAIASLETDEAYQLEYESTTKNDIDFKLKDYVSREAVRRIIKSPRTQEQMLNALNSLRNATECKAEDCINRDYTAKYVEEFANNEYVSQDEAETIYLIADGIRHIPSILPKVTKNDLGVEHHKQNIQAYAHDFGVSEEQAETELRVTKNDLGVDCVSRQAVLVAMRNNHRDGGRDIDGDYIEGNYSEKLYDAITSLPPATPQEPRWIPISERLPEDSGEYLVSVIDEYNEDQSYYKAVEVAWFAHKKDYDIKESEWRELGIDEKVIAWMSLPLPWEGE